MTLDQIQEAAIAPLGDAPELEAVKAALLSVDVVAAVNAVRKMRALSISPEAAVARVLATQQKTYGYHDCLDLVRALTYERFGE